MRDRTDLTTSAQWVPLLLLGAIVLAGCPAVKTEPLADETRVTSSSELFTTAARNLMEPCNNPAEFGRCACYLDGIRTSCAIVMRCLEVGFCQVAKAQPSDTSVTSESEVFTAAATSLMEPCNNPAEFGRCGCFLDGIRTSCDIVNRCLENGFCVRVAAD